jgi:alpha-L-arabinofuranosidase
MNRLLRQGCGQPFRMPCRSLLWVAVALACAAAAAPTPARADDNADQNIYLDYIAGSWDDWSFNATRVWNATEHVHSFSYSGKMSFTQAFGAVRLHFRGFDTRAFDTNGFTALQFSVHWGDAAPQQGMLVYALRNEDFNKIPTKLQLSKFMAPDLDAEEDGWYLVQIPLTDLGVANVTDLTDILLSGPTPKMPFWLDDIKLVRPSTPRRISLNVDASKPLRTLDGRHLGVNTATWDPLLADPMTLARVQASGARFFRFPGGGTADQYHWQQNTMVSATAGADTTEFMKLVQAVGGQAIITANYATGTPAEAAAWVHFCNVDHSYNVKYWEIGNENYQTGEPGSHDPLVYAQRFGDFYAAMKAVDPTIKIGMAGTYSSRNSAPSGASPGPGQGDTGTEYGGWGPKVLKALKVIPDFYVVHYFPEVQWSGTPHEDDADLLQYPRDWATIAPIVRGMLNQTLGAAASGVEILATENDSPGQKPGKQSVSIVNALYLADSLGQALSTEIAGFLWWDLHNGSEAKNNNSSVLYGYREYGDYGLLSSSDNPATPANTPYPAYYALQLASEIAGPGSRLVASSSNDVLLPIYASLRPDGNLALLVINKSAEQQLLTTLNVAGFPATKMHVEQYDDFQDSVGAGVFTYDLPVSSPQSVFFFPSYSITVLILQP